MSAKGLHKLMGGQFTRVKPNLCGFCKFYEVHPDWYGRCTANQTLLSNPRTATGRCKEFERAPEQRVSDEVIATWKQDGQEG